MKAKIQNASDCQLNLVYCVGETKEQHNNEETLEVCSAQLELLKDAVEDWSKVVIVYEPLWAMNTGVLASMDQTQEACEMLREWVKSNIGEEQSEEVRVVYGGNVTETNCETWIKQPDVDGFLIGSSSTKPIFRTIFDFVNCQVEKHEWESRQ